LTKLQNTQLFVCSSAHWTSLKTPLGCVLGI